MKPQDLTGTAQTSPVSAARSFGTGQCKKTDSYVFIFSLIGYFLTLLPVKGATTSATLSSLVFLPSKSCQVTHQTDIAAVCLNSTNLQWFFSPQIYFYYYFRGAHGNLQVLIQHGAQMTEIWKLSAHQQTETWLQIGFELTSDNSFQVCDDLAESAVKVVMWPKQENSTADLCK